MSEVRSMRGVKVNFDLLKIQQSLSNTPTPQVVVERQQAIEERIQRRRLLRQQKANERRLLEEGDLDDLEEVAEEVEAAPKQTTKRKTVAKVETPSEQEEQSNE